MSALLGKTGSRYPHWLGTRSGYCCIAASPFSGKTVKKYFKNTQAQIFDVGSL